MNRKDWFKKAKYGLFIHWGLFSLLERGEWIMYRERIPADEYALLANEFDPQDFNMDSLCSFAVECGMRYAVLTTCHHEGFALFDSKADAFNSMNAPCHRDFVAEFVTSCRKYGLGVGLYYSLGDWRFGIMKESDSAEKAAAMRDLTFAQVRELMTNYGQIDILWYDGCWQYPSTYHDTIESAGTFWHAEELNGMVRSLQKDILINNRSGSPEDFSTPEGGHGFGAKDRLTEACYTLGADDNSHWGFFRNESFRKTPAHVMQLTLDAICKGHNLLLNVGPDRNGVIPAWQRDLLLERGRWLKKHEEAAYDVHYTETAMDVNLISGNPCCDVSENEEAVFCYLKNYPGRETFIPFMKAEIADAILLGTDIKLTCTKKRQGILIQGLPEEAPDPLCSVVKLFKKK